MGRGRGSGLCVPSDAGLTKDHFHFGSTVTMRQSNLAMLVGLVFMVSSGLSRMLQFEQHFEHPDWIEGAALGASTDPVHQLIFAIPQRNLDVIEKTLLAVSAPDSPQYGEYLSFEEVGRLISNNESLAAVRAWLRTAPTSRPQCEATPHGEYLTCSAATSVWNALLQAQFREYSLGATKVVRAPRIFIPEELQPHLKGIFLATDIPHLFEASGYGTRKSAAEASDPYCDSHPCATPALLHQVYNISNSSGQAMHGSQSVFETGGQYMSPKVHVECVGSSALALALALVH